MHLCQRLAGVRLITELLLSFVVCLAFRVIFVWIRAISTSGVATTSNSEGRGVALGEIICALARYKQNLCYNIFAYYHVPYSIQCYHYTQPKGKRISARI